MLDYPVSQLKLRTEKIFPQLKTLSLRDDHWAAFHSIYQKRNCKMLTRLFIIACFSKIVGLSYEDFEQQLKSSLLSRSSKPKRPYNPPHISKRKRSLNAIEENPLICNAHSTSPQLHSPLAKHKIRITPLSPETPKHGYSQVFHTPTKKTKVRALFRNNKGCFFTPLTPIGSKEKGGMVDLTDANPETIRKNLPHLNYEIFDHLSFDITLKELQERQGVKRRISQNQLIKASCREIFEAHGVSTLKADKGSDYHHCHGKAHAHGGEQDPANIIFATAAANYNTLELIEQPISIHLERIFKIHPDTASIHVEIKLSRYPNSLIPNEINYYLTWEENGNKKFEEIYINARSYKRVTPTILKSIETLRQDNESSSQSLSPSKNPRSI